MTEKYKKYDNCGVTLIQEVVSGKVYCPGCGYCPSEYAKTEKGDLNYVG